MKTIENLENEYEKFVIKSDFVKTYKDFIAFMYLSLEETYSIEQDYKREMKTIKKDEFRAKLGNKLLFQNNDLSFYKYDREIILELTDMIFKYREFYERVLSVSNEDNYLKLVKLVDFINKYYDEHIYLYEFRRDRLEMYLKGIDMSNSKYEDNREVLYEFADKKINVFDKEKVYSKKVSE